METTENIVLIPSPPLLPGFGRNRKRAKLVQVSQCKKKPFPDKIIFLHWNKFVSVMLYDMLSLYANVKLYGNESKNISDFHVCSGQPKTTSDSKQF